MTAVTAPVALLRTAILTGPAVAAAADIWLAASDLDHLPPEQYPLLPLALRAIEQAAPDHPWLPRLRGINRRAWYTNQLMLGAADKLTQPLVAGGIPVILADAVSLALTAYVGRLRPISSLSLIVPAARAEEACRILADQGWQGVAPAAAAPSGSVIWVTSRRFRVENLASPSIRVHSRSVVGSAGGQLADLHWCAAAFWPSEAMDAAAWDRARPITLAGQPALALSAADQLARSCWIAAHPGPASLIALADAAVLLMASHGGQAGEDNPAVEQTGAIDWDIALQLAATCHVGRALRATLECLETTLHISAPPVVMARLRALPLSSFESMERGGQHPAGAAIGRMHAARLVVAQYCRTAAARGLKPKWGTFLTFLQQRWSLSRRSSIFREIVARLRW